MASGSAPAERRQSPAELWAEAFDPGERLLVWQWADRHRELTEGAEKGRWRTDRVPWLRFPMEVMSVTHPAQEIVLQTGAQVGKTACVLNFLGYVIDHEPDEMMLVLGTLETAMRYVRTRIDSLVEGTEVLREKVAQRRMRDAGNTRLLKRFDHGWLRIAGAGSPKSLREASVRYLILEELSGYEDGPPDGEGDPVVNAEIRTRSYEGRRKILKISTPNRAGTCRIDAARQAADVEYRYHVPCPACGHHQALEWERFVYDVPAQTADGGRPRISDVRYACAGCGELIPESAKTAMVAAGRWEAVRDNGSATAVAFFLPALYSTLGFTWVEAARSYEAAKADSTRMQSFVNSVLALPFAEPREAPRWEPLFARREAWPRDEVPPGVRCLTAGVDVQSDRIEVEVVGWGRGLRSWPVTYRVLVGDVEQDAVWRELGQLVDTEWSCAGGGTLPIWVLAIDSGHAPERVFRWARTRQRPSFGGGHVAVREPRTVMAVKGVDRWGAALQLAQKAGASEKKRGLKTVLVATSGLKAELYRWIRLEPPAPGQPEPNGYLHVPEWLGETWFKQLTAEHRELYRAGGRDRERWVLPAGARNEALDCRVYARAAVAALNVTRYSERDWARLERKLPAGLLADGPLPLAAARPAPSHDAAAQPATSARRPVRRRVVFTSPWSNR